MEAITTSLFHYRVNFPNVLFFPSSFLLKNSDLKIIQVYGSGESEVNILDMRIDSMTNPPLNRSKTKFPIRFL